MNDFEYRGGELFCEDVRAKDLIEKYGTPLYVYSRKAISGGFDRLSDAFRKIDHLICFSVKSCSNLGVLRVLKEKGSGFDIVSGGELFRIEEINADMSKVVFAGVGKTNDEIEYALEQNILMFNVESEQEAERINSVAGDLGVEAGIAIRINPDVDPKTHKYITTGKSENKFGVDIERGYDLYKKVAGLKNLAVKGIQMHIGSQITEIEPYVTAVGKIARLAERIKKDIIPLSYMDIGGGMGIVYKDEKPFDVPAFAEAVIKEIKSLGMKLIIEPGRYISGNSGVLLTQVQYLKKSAEKNFVIVDAGMNDLIRPSLYGAYHRIEPVSKRDKSSVLCDVVGPVCESGDFIAKDREIGRVSQDDYLCVFSAGAYGAVMSSNYNSRPRAAEVLVDGNEDIMIRKREEYLDLTRLDNPNI
ncbi:MAG: diaminopimelate decarboxylase [Candidatus Aureabacteria bacterium]|nr:diaminopimelate decarboxylase [Candidatus Auribacterota bacterium]